MIVKLNSCLECPLCPSPVSASTTQSHYFQLQHLEFYIFFALPLSVCGSKDFLLSSAWFFKMFSLYGFRISRSVSRVCLLSQPTRLSRTRSFHCYLFVFRFNFEIESSGFYGWLNERVRGRLTKWRLLVWWMTSVSKVQSKWDCESIGRLKILILSGIRSYFWDPELSKEVFCGDEGLSLNQEQLWVQLLASQYLSLALWDLFNKFEIGQKWWVFESNKG